MSSADQQDDDRTADQNDDGRAAFPEEERLSGPGDGQSSEEQLGHRRPELRIAEGNRESYDSGDNRQQKHHDKEQRSVAHAVTPPSAFVGAATS